MAVTTGRFCWRPQRILSPGLHRQHKSICVPGVPPTNRGYADYRVDVSIRLNGLSVWTQCFSQRARVEAAPTSDGLIGPAIRYATSSTFRPTWARRRPSEEFCGRIGRALPVRLPQAL
jgi:hypothetical protein